MLRAQRLVEAAIMSSCSSYLNEHKNQDDVGHNLKISDCVFTGETSRPAIEYQTTSGVFEKSLPWTDLNYDKFPNHTDLELTPLQPVPTVVVPTLVFTNRTNTEQNTTNSDIIENSKKRKIEQMQDNVEVERVGRKYRTISEEKKLIYGSS